MILERLLLVSCSARATERGSARGTESGSARPVRVGDAAFQNRAIAEAEQSWVLSLLGAPVGILLLELLGKVIQRVTQFTYHPGFSTK